MNTIGNFKLDGEKYSGFVNTLTFSGPVSIEPNGNKVSEGSPDYRVYAGRSRSELGAAWKERSEGGKEYLSVRLDDPSFSSPIFSRLVQFEKEEGFRLVWSRS